MIRDDESPCGQCTVPPLECSLLIIEILFGWRKENEPGKRNHPWQVGTPDVQPTSLAGPGDVDQIEGRPPLPFFVIYVAGQPKRKKSFLAIGTPRERDREKWEYKGKEEYRMTRYIILI